MNYFAAGYDVATGNGEVFPPLFDATAQNDWLSGFIWAMMCGAEADVSTALRLCVPDELLCAQIKQYLPDNIKKPGAK